VQRSAITLLEKGIPFDREDIDLKNKPTWFLEISPTGKVPVLVVDGKTAIFESAIINEYLDEVSGSTMLPRDPLARARARAWVEVGAQMLMQIYWVQVGKEEEKVRAATAKLVEYLGHFERAIEGPLFAGETFTLVDAALAPALQRMTWIHELKPTLDFFGTTPKAAAWRDAVLKRDSVKRSTVPDILDRFLARARRDEAWIVS
jgi:glutathione S-transferase